MSERAPTLLATLACGRVEAARVSLERLRSTRAESRVLMDQHRALREQAAVELAIVRGAVEQLRATMIEQKHTDAAA